MKILKHTALALTSLLLAGLAPAFGGQALFAPIKDFYDGAALVVIVEVKNVTKVVVPTGENQTSEVCVAEAEVIQTLKSDHNPTPEKRKIAIIGSTIPNSSAVWEPIERKRFLAFLNPEQGHYRYGEKFAMRPINPEDKVDWIDKNAKGDYELSKLDVEEAIKRIRREQDTRGNRR